MEDVDGGKRKDEFLILEYPSQKMTEVTEFGHFLFFRLREVVCSIYTSQKEIRS